MTAVTPVPPTVASDGEAGQPGTAAGRRLRHPLWAVYQWEIEKLTAQARVRLIGLVVIAGPWLVALGLRLASDVPSDTLFGRWVGDSGYAVCLLILGLAGAYGLPLLVSLVAGDIFAAEDHHGTWSGLLTRSVSRRSIFGGKVLAAFTFATVLLVLLALGSLLAGLTTVGHQPLIGLSGNLIGSGRAVGLVAAAWLSVLPAAWCLAGLGIATSILTRSSIAGIVVPVVVAALGQLAQYVGGPVDPIRSFLPGASTSAWVGLFADPVFLGPVWAAATSGALCALLFLLCGWLRFRTRDES